MFYMISQAKKYLKGAYKGAGLVVGQTAEGILYTSGSFWILCQDIANTPKEYKAAIIELAGELPAPGEEFRATEDGNQMQIPNLDLYNLMDKYADIDRVGNEYEETDVYIKGPSVLMRIVVGIAINYAKMIRSDACNMVNRDGISHENGETDIEGPFETPDDRDWLIWHNDDTWFALAPIWLYENDDLKNLVDIVLKGFHAELISGKKTKNP